jgi:hypothetical protein
LFTFPYPFPKGMNVWVYKTIMVVGVIIKGATSTKR